MNTSLALQAMEALLRQGRTVSALSWLYSGGAVLWLVLATLACRDVAPAAHVAAGVVLAAGVVQTWYALRLGFDAGLMRALAPHAGVEDTAALVDSTLAELRLATPRGATRDWAARWRGSRGLMHRQAGCVMVQLAAFVAMLVSGDGATCWNA